MAPSPSSTCDFALVGGGIVGACLAEELASHGAAVVVLDAGTEPGHATSRAAGVAVPSLRYLSDPEFYRWLQSAKSCLDEDVRRLEPEHGVFSVTKPIVRALRPSDLDQFGDELDALNLGRWVQHGELASVAPGMTLPAGRRYLLDDSGLMVDGRRYLHAVRQRCLANGVVWRQETPVHHVEDDPVAVVTESGTVRAGRVILTTGAWTGSRGLAPATGVRPQRGQLVVLRSTVDLPCILSSACYLAQGVNGDVVVGATEEEAGFAEHVTAEGVSRLLMFAVAAMPQLGQSVPVELRASLRPVTATGRPVVGRLPGRDRVFVAAGHAGHGLLSARRTARGMAAGLLRDDWDELPYSMCPTQAIGR